MSEASQDETTLRLKALPAGAAGRGLALRAGDTLLAVNGRAFSGDASTLARRFADRRGRPLALTFARGEGTVTVLADRADLGQWESVPQTETRDEPGRIDPDLLRNWEILRSRDGLYDLHPLAAPTLALVLPPVWLLQMRLWVPFATLCAALVASGLVALWAVAIVWGAAGLHMRHAATAYLRLDRRALGLVPHSVHAARSEAEVHALHRRLHPGDRFLFERTAKPEPAESL